MFLSDNHDAMDLIVSFQANAFDQINKTRNMRLTLSVTFNSVNAHRFSSKQNTDQTKIHKSRFIYKNKIKYPMEILDW